MKNQLVSIVSQLLKGNKISFDKKELEFQIQSHPSYPSLHSITGVLEHFKIENIAANVPVNKETLNHLPIFFIAQVIDDNRKDIVVVEKRKESYTISKDNTRKEKLKVGEFIKRFTGIIVAVEKPEEVDAKIDLNIWIRNFLFIGFVTSLLYLIYNLNTPFLNSFYLLLCSIGGLISIVIIKKELGQDTVIGNAFCSGVSERKDCDAVLTSKGAEIIKGYKLSDFCLLYFTILTILTFVNLQSLKVSFILSLLAFPVTIYSIYYQYFVLKKWCLLCLTIVGVLWIQSFIVLLSFNTIYQISVNNFLVFLMVTSLIILIWSFMKPLFFEVNSLRKEKIKAVKFQRNFNVFDALLKKSKVLDTNIKNINEVIFGNENSNLVLVVITNPFCGHCRPVHKMIEEILLKYNNDVKIIIRFSVNIENTDSDVFKVTTKILEIYKKEGKDKCLIAMDDIYSGMKTTLWLKKWGNCIEKEILTLQKEKEWCIKNAINFTPEILINGKSYPKEYSRSDLIYFIEELSEKK